MTSIEAPRGWSIPPTAIRIDTSELRQLAGKLESASTTLSSARRPPKAPSLPSPCIDLNSLVAAATGNLARVGSHLNEMAAQLRRRSRFVPPEAYPFVSSTAKEGGAELATLLRNAKSKDQRAALLGYMTAAFRDPAVARQFFSALGGRESYALLNELDSGDDLFVTVAEAFAAATTAGLSREFNKSFLLPEEGEQPRAFDGRVRTILAILTAAGASNFGDRYLVDLGSEFLPIVETYSVGFNPYVAEVNDILTHIAESPSAAAKLLHKSAEALLMMDGRPWNGDRDGLGGRGLGALIAAAGGARPELARDALASLLDVTSKWGVPNENVAIGVKSIVEQNATWLTNQVLASLQPNQTAKSEALARSFRDTLIAMRHWDNHAKETLQTFIDVGSDVSPPASAREVERLAKTLGFVRATLLTQLFRQSVAGEDAEAIRRGLLNGIGGVTVAGLTSVSGPLAPLLGPLLRLGVSAAVNRLTGGGTDDAKEFLRDLASSPALSFSELDDILRQSGVSPDQAAALYLAFDHSSKDIADLETEDFHNGLGPYRPNPLTPDR